VASHRVLRQAGEIAGEYLKKGSPVYVEGGIRTRKWQDKEGQDRYSTEIVADRMQMLGSRGGGSESAAREPAGREPQAASSGGGGGARPRRQEGRRWRRVRGNGRRHPVLNR